MERCRSCRQRILWAVTVPGHKRVPLNEDTANPGDFAAFVLVDGKWAYHPADLLTRMSAKRGMTTWEADQAVTQMPHHLSHFATCPDAEQHRRRR